MPFSKLRIAAVLVAGAASLFATAASAGARPCASAADCGGAYRPASARYAFVPPAPTYAPGYDQGGQGGYEVGGDPRSWAPPAPQAQTYGGDPRTWGPPLPPAPYARDNSQGAYAHGVYAERASVQGGYTQNGYARASYAERGYVQGGPAGYPAPPAQAAYPNPCAAPGCAPLPPPPAAAPCGPPQCVPAYAYLPVAPRIEEVRLVSDFYTGGVGVTDFQGGGGGGYGNGNFEVQGFGDVSAFTSSKAVAWANADAYAKSVALSQANAKAYASAQSNVNISIKGGFWGKSHGGGGCDTCQQPKPQPVSCNTCGGGVGGGGHGSSGWGGKSWGYAPTPRGCSTCGGGKRGH